MWSVVCKELVCNWLRAVGRGAVGWHVRVCMVGWCAASCRVSSWHEIVWCVSRLCVVGGVESSGVQALGVQSVCVQWYAGVVNVQSVGVYSVDV